MYLPLLYRMSGVSLVRQCIAAKERTTAEVFSGAKIVTDIVTRVVVCYACLADLAASELSAPFATVIPKQAGLYDVLERKYATQLTRKDSIHFRHRTQDTQDHKCRHFDE